MKLICFIGSLVILLSVNANAQTPSPTDTLLPAPSKPDTTIAEPKLRGGALIDTINTEKNKYKLKPIHPGDTLHERPDTSGTKPRKK